VAQRSASPSTPHEAAFLTTWRYFVARSPTFPLALAGALCVVGAAVAASAVQYNFDKTAQGWTGDAPCKVAVSTAKHLAGSGSLAITAVGNKTNSASVYKPKVKPGAVVVFHIWAPAKGIVSLQPFVQDAKYQWAGAWTTPPGLKANAWNTITVKVPAKAATPIFKVGVQVTGDGKSSPTIYLDSVSW